MVSVDAKAMTRALHRLRKSFMSRGMRYVVALALILGLVMPRLNPIGGKRKGHQVMA